MAEGMEYGMNEGYEKLDELLAAGADMGKVVSLRLDVARRLRRLSEQRPRAAVRLVRGRRRRDRQRRRSPAVPPHPRERRLLDRVDRASSAASSSAGCSSTSPTAGRASIRSACRSSCSPTRRRPTGRTPAPATRTSSPDGIEAAIARAKEIAGEKSVGVAAGTIAGQAIAAGLIDEVAIDLVPVVLGEGHPYFADVAPDAVRLGDPTVVIPARETRSRTWSCYACGDPEAAGDSGQPVIEQLGPLSASRAGCGAARHRVEAWRRNASP